MNIYDIKTRIYNELSQGYYSEKEYVVHFVTLLDVTRLIQMKQHLKRNP